METVMPKSNNPKGMDTKLYIVMYRVWCNKVWLARHIPSLLFTIVRV